MPAIVQRSLPVTVFILLCISAATALARERVPAPEPVPAAGAVLAADNLPAAQAPDSGSAEPPAERVPGDLGEAAAIDKAGGVAVTVLGIGQVNTSSIDVASNGDLFAAASYYSGSDALIGVYRSGDGGATWEVWGTLGEGSEEWYDAEILVAEGDVDRCYVAASQYVVPAYDRQLWIAWADLTDATADFAATAVPVMDTADVSFDDPRLIADDSAYSDFYLYLVAEGNEGNGTDIWFARSTSFGATWETPYTIATINVSDRHYVKPDIAQGYTGRLHVAWSFDHGTTTLDDAIRTRSVDHYGDGGSSAWEPVRSLTSTSNGLEEYAPRIGARWDSEQVVVTERRAVADGPILRVQNPGVFVSVDAGTTFVETAISDGISTSLTGVYDLLFDADRDRWVMGGRAAGTSDPALSTAPGADPTDWSPRDPFEENGDGVYLQHMDIVLDPTRSGRVAAIWHNWVYESGSYDHTEMIFDAEWRGDPGWPVPLAGFPVDLPSAPSTDPCLVDLDGDGDLEILCGSGATIIEAWHHDGTEVDGWPVGTGLVLTAAPIAVGDLNGDGEPWVVACSDHGDVVARHADGSSAWVWWSISPGYPAFASIGAFGGPEPRQICVFQNRTLYFLDSNNYYPVGTGPRDYPGATGRAEAPPAVGDVDGDGLPEAVFYLGNEVHAVSMRPGGTEWSRILPADVAGAPILVDIDDDKDVEVVVTARNGLVYLLDDGGVDYPAPGWPFDTGAGAPLSGLSAASILPGDSWEFAFTGHDDRLHVIGKDGSYSDGFPVTMPAALPVTPILAPMDGDAADLLFPDMAGSLHAWHYKGGEMTGWPQSITPGLALSPSVGDLDNDGILDVVWLTERFLHACSLGQPVGGPRDSWPMAFYDAQRTSCADCDENLVSAAGNEETAAVFSFAAPRPNPVHDRTVLSFMLPREAEVDLEVYDLRGRRVATLLRGSLAPGHHAETWTGRDDHGRAAASGHYVARLRVDGEVRNRKITLVR